MKTGGWLPGIAAALLAAAAPSALAAPTYTITDLGDIGSYAVAYGVSDSGLACGYGGSADGYEHAFLWEDGVMTDLGACGVPYAASYGMAVNDSGQVAGYWIEAIWGDMESVVWQGGTWTQIPAMAEWGGNAEDINESGVVVGTSTDWSAYDRAYLWDGVVHDLGDLGGGTSEAHAINNSNQVTGTSQLPDGGSHAFLWDNGVMTDLGALDGDYSLGMAINNLADVAGYSYDASGELHAVAWLDGVIINLGLTQPDGGYSYAQDINDSGQIVGIMRSPSLDIRPFLWEDGAAVDINALLPENSGWTLGGAYGINNSGQIVGYGDHNESVRAFLMTPEPSTVPAPGALVLGLLGLGGIGAARRARSARR